MRALVIGASGLVGGALMRTTPKAWKVIGTTHRQHRPELIQLDITDPKAVDLLIETGFDWVLLPAANPNVDGCERDPTNTRRINVEAVGTVVEACERTGAGLCYFSSDYVFDGTAGPYSESDTPNPINEYGRQKLEAESIVRQMDRHLVVRTTGVFGIEAQQKNFAYRVIQTLGRGEVLRVPIDQMGNPTLADKLAEATWQLCAKEIGLFHVAGRDWVSRFEFAQQISEAFELDSTLLEGVTTSMLRQIASRPLNAGLISNNAVKAACFECLSIQKAISDFKNWVN